MAGELIILLAEDDPNDVVLLQMAMQRNGLRMPLHISTDGEDAIKYLKGEGLYSDRAAFPFPRVVITDLKMPKASGFDLLAWLQAHPECNLIPKLVLSSSAHESDVQECYRLGANAYLVKPRTLDELVEMTRVVIQFWSVCQLPKLPDHC